MVRVFITLMGLAPNVFPFKLSWDHSRLQNSQEGLEIANPVRRILLTWQLKRLYPPGNIFATCLGITLSAGELDTIPKNNLPWGYRWHTLLRPVQSSFTLSSVYSTSACRAGQTTAPVWRFYPLSEGRGGVKGTLKGFIRVGFAPRSNPFKPFL